MTEEDLVGSATAAEMLGVSTISVARYVRQGRLRPSDRLPYGQGILRFRLADIEEFRMSRNPDRHRIEAQALRDAAEALRSCEGPFEESDAAVSFWLDARADKIQYGDDGARE